MTRTSTGLAAAVLGAMVFLLAGLLPAQALPNTGGGGGLNYCRQHCSPIARQAQRNSCISACMRRSGPVNVGCLVGANGCADVASHTPPPHSPTHGTVTHPGGGVETH